MRPLTVERELESTIEGETIDFTLDQASLVHLMNQYIDLYEDSEMAVVREYSTNARDSHVAAGNSDPIRITLPTLENPVLVIQDWGLGMSHADIKEIFSKYGASTKRHSNDYNGVLGLGCKAGMTYADQFTMVAVKDGLRNVALISRDGSGAARIVIAERDAETDEPNGVTIQIPAKRHNSFTEKAAKLFRYWPLGTVLVNGEQPARFEGRRVLDNLYLYRRKQNWHPSENVIVMGGVPYPFDKSDLGFDVGHDHDVIAFVPNGTVEFTPNREGLRDTKPNKAAILRVGQDLKHELLRVAREDVDAATTPAEALRKAAEWMEDLPKSVCPETWAYRGQEMPAKFEAPKVTVGDIVSYQSQLTVVSERSKTLSAHSREKDVAFETACDAVWFYGFTTKFSANHRRRLNLWLAEYTDAGGHTPRHFILAEEKPDMAYLEDDRVFPWEDVKAFKLPTQYGGGGGRSGRLKGSYDAFINGNPFHHEVLAANIDQDEPVFYFAANERTSQWERTRAGRAQPYVDLIWQFEPDATVVLLPETRVAKLCREFVGAESVQDYAQRRFASWSAKLTEEQLLALVIHDVGVQDRLRGLDTSRVLDAELRDAIALANLDIGPILQARSQFTEIRMYLPDQPEWVNPLAHYPLFADYHGRGDQEHIYAYLNAAYRLRLDPEGC